MIKWNLILGGIGATVGLWLLNRIAEVLLGRAYKRIMDRLYAWTHPPLRVRDWMERLNQAMAGQVVFHSELDLEPEVVVLGPLDLTEAQKALRGKHLLRLRDRHAPNDRHAVLVGEPDWHLEPLRLEVRHVDYAGVCALRDSGERPRILSSNAVVTCAEDRELVVQRRDAKVATFPGHLHTFGGALIPKVHEMILGDGSLQTTFEREMLEETDCTVNSDVTIRRVVAEEVATGFVQLVRFGYDISRRQKVAMRPNWEGRVQFIRFDALLGEAERNPWVPTGLGHVLAWLAMGTPGLKRRARFKGLASDRLFHAIVGSSWFRARLSTRASNPEAALMA